MTGLGVRRIFMGQENVYSGRSVKNKFFTCNFVPAAQSLQVVERVWLLV